MKKNIHRTGIHFSSKYLHTSYMIDIVAGNDDTRRRMKDTTNRGICLKQEMLMFAPFLNHSLFSMLPKITSKLLTMINKGPSRRGPCLLLHPV